MADSRQSATPDRKTARQVFAGGECQPLRASGCGAGRAVVATAPVRLHFGGTSSWFFRSWCGLLTACLWTD
jgi:hypothetical protein